MHTSSTTTHSQHPQLPPPQSNNMSTKATNTSSTVGPRAKCDQVIYEAICKACEIIVGSRSHVSSGNHHHATTSAITTATPRFNLQVPEVMAVRHLLSQYRLQLLVPIRLDVYYQYPSSEHDEDTNQNGNNGGGNHCRRELLERWCLEYKSVASNERFLQTEGYNMVLSKNDPMAQLTHVCKRIVIWLRTLYCWTRLLPAHQLPSSSIHAKHIGFSIYVHSDYTVDDTSDLIHNQGFACHSSSQNRTGSSGMSYNNNGLVTTTPYGELSWQVVYCPQSKLERIIPQLNHTKNNSHVVVRIQPPSQHTPRRSQPIPMASKNTYNNIDSEPTSNFAPRSAPATQYYQPPTRTTSYTERSQQRMSEAAAAAVLPPYHQTNVPPLHNHMRSQLQSTPPTVTGKSFDPNRHRHMLMHHKSDINDHQHHQLNQQQQQQQHHSNQNHPSIIQRSQTTIGNPSSPLKIQKPVVVGTSSSNIDKQPERVMSGLSLALLMASNDDDHNHHNTDAMASQNSQYDKMSIFRNTTTTNAIDGDTTVEDRLATLHVQNDEGIADNANNQGSSSYQTRRAALHQMPPHLLQHQQQQQSNVQPPQSMNDEGNTGEHGNNNSNGNAFGDYGYGYNNHIPWQKIHPSQSNPTMAQPHLFVHTNSFGARTTLSTSPTITPMSPIQPHFATNNSNNNNNSYSGRDISPMGGAYFLRSTPSSTVGGGGLGHFIPPRNRSDSMNSRSVTPPFQPRPMGFIQQPDPPTMFLDPSTATSRLSETSDVAPSRKTPSKVGSSPPVTSLDSLRSSPFQQSQQLMTLQTQHRQDSHSAMFSSLAAVASVLPPPISTPGGGGMESDYLTAPMSLAPSFLLDATSSSSMRRSLWGQRSSFGGSGVMPSSLAGLAGRHQHNYLLSEQSNDDFYSEEMPFALEIPTPSILDGSTSSSQHPSKSGVASKALVGASSTFGGTSSSLATLAQKCSAPNQRLKMFDKPNMMASSTVDPNGPPSSEIEDITNNLADQLQEFRAFGASLHSSSVVLPQQETNAHSNFGGGDDRNVLTGSGTSSTSTPISLKS